MPAWYQYPYSNDKENPLSLYRVIDEHLDTFLEAAAQHADGHRLPKFVEQESRDYLTPDLARSARDVGMEGLDTLDHRISSIRRCHFRTSTMSPML
jgi:hypothetical protein